MSEGVIKIGRKGIRKFAFGDGAEFAIDVISVRNEWLEIDRSFRDENSMIAPENVAKLNQSALAFVREVAKDQSVNMSEALEFMARLTEEAAKLRRFFVPAFDEKLESQGSSEPGSAKPAVVFSE